MWSPRRILCSTDFLTIRANVPAAFTAHGSALRSRRGSARSAVLDEDIGTRRSDAVDSPRRGRRLELRVVARRQRDALVKELTDMPTEDSGRLSANDASEKEGAIGVARAVRGAQEGQRHVRVVYALRGDEQIERASR